jgi:hypothetical protein
MPFGECRLRGGEHPAAAVMGWARRLGSQRRMGAVAERLVAGPLAAAQIHGLRLLGREDDGHEGSLRVRAVAERLLGAASATAPCVFPAGFHVDGERGLLGDNGIVHGVHAFFLECPTVEKSHGAYKVTQSLSE